MERKIKFENKGMNVVGILNIPKSPRLGIVLVHGLTGNKNEANGLFKDTARRFARNHIATLRIDCRNSKPWDGAPNESDGMLANMRPCDWVSDIKRAVDFLDKNLNKNKEEKDKIKIGVLGISYGALASIIACEKERKIKFLVTWSAPAKDIYREFSPLNAVAKIDFPKLFLHGSEDKVVPCEDSKKLYKKSHCSKRFVLIEGADHVFSKHKSLVIEETLKWLKELV
jgi:dipeptidyl aminopeptidase/acylaminoacyl peptidase